MPMVLQVLVPALGAFCIGLLIAFAIWGPRPNENSSR